MNEVHEQTQNSGRYFGGKIYRKVAIGSFKKGDIVDSPTRLYKVKYAGGRIESHSPYMRVYRHGF